MDKQAFKQRMQDLKSYRENNPGKGYWDWRNNLPDNLKYTDDTEYDMVSAYNSGAQPTLEEDGSYHLPTRVPNTGKILKSSIHPTYWRGLAEDEKLGYHTYWLPDGSTYTASKQDAPIQAFADGGEVNKFQRKTRAELMREAAAGGRPSYEGMFQKQNEYQKDFAKYWYTERAKNPQYASQIGGEKLKQVLDNVEKATWKTPTEAMRDNLTNLGYTPAEEQIKQQVDILKENGTRGFANPKSHSYSTFGLKSTWHEGVGHMVGDNTPSILQATPNIHISNSDASFEEYVNQDNEKHAQTWDFRGNNANLKDDQGNYFIDPNRQLTPEDIGNMRKKGAEIPDQWQSLDDNEISELTNTFAYNMSQDPIQYMVNGGETGDPDENFVRAINAKLGRTPDGRPKEQGLKNTMEFRDMLDFTPVGDVLAAKDTYDAVKANDWVGAGLAAASMIPFVPSSIRKVSKKFKQIPSVHKDTQQLLDAKFQQLDKLAQRKADYGNEQYRIIERVMEDPSYMNRAKEVKQKFGDDYSIPYADMFIAYNIDPDALPNVQLMDELKRAGSMQRTVDGRFIYKRNPDNDYIPNTAEHELSHFTDLLKSGRPDAHANNNVFYQMTKDLTKRVGDEHDAYFLLPTEQKAHMKQLREWMFQNGYINSRDQKVTPEYMSKIMKRLDAVEGMKGIQRAAQQFRSNRTFTKWFNSIPLIGVGLLGVNKYFTNEDKQEKQVR